MKLRAGFAFLATLAGIAPAPAMAGTPGMTTTGASIVTVFSRDIGMDIYTTANSNPMGCSVANWFRIQSGVANGSVLVSTALTAFSAHKTVQFWVGACDTDGVSIVYGVMTN